MCKLLLQSRLFTKLPMLLRTRPNVGLVHSAQMVSLLPLAVLMLQLRYIFLTVSCSFLVLSQVSVLKVLDVDRMLAKSSPDGEMAIDQQGHPVIRTLYDHVEEVTCLEFHPRDSILASGSRDCTVKLFDFSKAAAKKAFKTFTVL